MALRLTVRLTGLALSGSLVDRSGPRLSVPALADRRKILRTTIGGSESTSVLDFGP